jgi:hypothetical protein
MVHFNETRLNEDSIQVKSHRPGDRCIFEIRLSVGKLLISALLQDYPVRCKRQIIIIKTRYDLVKVCRIIREYKPTKYIPMAP